MNFLIKTTLLLILLQRIQLQILYATVFRDGK